MYIWFSLGLFNKLEVYGNLNFILIESGRQGSYESGLEQYSIYC